MKTAVPRVNNHLFGRRCVLLEMFCLSVCLSRGGVIVHFEYQHVVRIFLRHEDIELVATWLSYGSRAVLRECPLTLE